MTGGLLKWVELGRKRLWPNEGMEENHEKFSIRIADVSAEIPRDHLLNTSVELCRHVNLLHKSLGWHGDSSTEVRELRSVHCSLCTLLCDGSCWVSTKTATVLGSVAVT